MFFRKKSSLQGDISKIPKNLLKILYRILSLLTRWFGQIHGIKNINFWSLREQEKKCANDGQHYYRLPKNSKLLSCLRWNMYIYWNFKNHNAVLVLNSRNIHQFTFILPFIERFSHVYFGISETALTISMKFATAFRSV